VATFITKFAAWWISSVAIRTRNLKLVSALILGISFLDASEMHLFEKKGDLVQGLNFRLLTEQPRSVRS
jgi:hypothetical protein